MINLNLNFLLGFESIYAEQKNTYIDYEIRTHNNIVRHAERRTYAGHEKWLHIPIPSPLPRHSAEIGGEDERANRRDSELLLYISASMDQGIFRRRHRIAQGKECAAPQAQADQNPARRGCEESCEQPQAGHRKSKRRVGERDKGIPFRINPETFFRSLGARYKRIRLTPKGIPSPQYCELFALILQELENLYNRGLINLFYGDESHVCTSGYVPYGWQFPDEKVRIPSEKSARLNIFGMISRDNEYLGFTTRESINSDKFIEYIDSVIDDFKRETVLVLDNASIHKSRKVRDKRAEWAEKGFFIVYLPPYSPHLNIAETVWRILKGKWIKPEHYATTDTLFSAVQNILDGIGNEYRIGFSHAA